MSISFLATSIILIIIFSFVLYFANNRRLSKEEFAILAINKMFFIAGHYNMNFQRAQEMDEYYLEYSMTDAQREKWEDWFILEAMDNFDYSYEQAKREFEWFDLQYGLTQNGIKHDGD